MAYPSGYWFELVRSSSSSSLVEDVAGTQIWLRTSDGEPLDQEARNTGTGFGAFGDDSDEPDFLSAINIGDLPDRIWRGRKAGEDWLPSSAGINLQEIPWNGRSAVRYGPGYFPGYWAELVRSNSNQSLQPHNNGRHIWLRTSDGEPLEQEWIRRFIGRTDWEAIIDDTTEPDLVATVTEASNGLFQFQWRARKPGEDWIPSALGLDGAVTPWGGTNSYRFYYVSIRTSPELLTTPGSGNFIVPPNVRSLRVELVGGGGRGGRGNTRESIISPSNTAGIDGEATSFRSNTANPGIGGSGATSGDSTGVTASPGGVASGGDVNINGEAGSTVLRSAGVGGLSGSRDVSGLENYGIGIGGRAGIRGRRGGGGGGGAYVRVNALAVTPGQSIPYAVGSPNGAIRITYSENAPPTVTINTAAQMVIGGRSLTLSATATDTDGTIASTQWTASAGTFDDATTLNTTWTAPASTGSVQQITLRLTATDDDGASTYAEIIITIPSNSPPDAVINTRSQTVAGGAVLPLDGMATDPDGTVASVLWTAPSGTFANPNTADTTWTAPAEQTREQLIRLRLTVTDDDGATDFAEVLIIVRAAPVIPTGLTAPSASIATIDSLTFTWPLPTTYGGEAPTSYNFRHREVGTLAWTTVDNLTSPSYQIMDLMEGTEYEAQWQATNSAGTSDWSPVGSARTLGQKSVGDWYIIDNNSIRRRPVGESAWGGVSLPAISDLIQARGIAVHPNGNVIVVGLQSGSFAARSWEYNGTSWGDATAIAPVPSSVIQGITITGDGTWYVVETQADKVYRRTAGAWEAASEGIALPTGIIARGVAVTRDDDILVSDSSGNVHRLPAGSSTWDAPVSTGLGSSGGIDVDTDGTWIVTRDDGVWRRTNVASNTWTKVLSNPSGSFTARGLAVHPRSDAGSGQTTSAEIEASNATLSVALPPDINLSGQATVAEASASRTSLTIELPVPATMSGMISTAEIDASSATLIVNTPAPVTLSGQVTVAEAEASQATINTVPFPAAGDLYLSGDNTDKIYRRSGGYQGTTWDDFIDAPDGEGKLTDIAFDSDGNLYATGNDTNRIYRRAGGFSGESWDSGITLPTGESSPRSIAFDENDDLYLAGNDTDKIYRRAGGYSGASWDAGISPPGNENAPFAIAFDSRGDLYLAGNRNDRIYRRAGGYSGPSWDSGITLPSGESSPSGIAFDLSDDLYLAGNSTDKIYRRTGGYSGASWDAGIAIPGDEARPFGIAFQSADKLSLSGSTSTAEISASSPSLNSIPPGDVILSGRITIAEASSSASLVVNTPDPAALQGQATEAEIFTSQATLLVSAPGDTNLTGQRTSAEISASRAVLLVSAPGDVNLSARRTTTGISISRATLLVNAPGDTTIAGKRTIAEISAARATLIIGSPEPTSLSGGVTISEISASRASIASQFVALPQITTFSVAPSTINVSGGSTTLTWATRYADNVSIDQGIGTVSANGTRSVTITASTVFTITATNSVGTITRSLSVIFHVPITTALDTLVSGDMVQSAFDEATDAIWVTLVTLSHPQITEMFGDDLRVVDNYENVVSRNLEYAGFPVEIILPKDTESGPPQARMTISNVSQEVVARARLVDSPINVKFEVVNALNPDVVEASYTGFVLRKMSGDVLSLTGTLALDDLTIEPYPADSFVPAYFQGIFA